MDDIIDNSPGGFEANLAGQTEADRRATHPRLISRYLEIAGDYEGLRVLPFCAVYRALVRAKVDALTIETVPSRASEFRKRLQQRKRAASQWTARKGRRSF